MAGREHDEQEQDLGEAGVIDESVTGWYRGCLLVSLAVGAPGTAPAAAALFAAARVAAAEHRRALVVDLQSPPADAPPLTVAAAERAMACAYIAANEGLASLRAPTSSTPATTSTATAATTAATTQPDVIVLPPVPRSRRAAPATYVPAGATVDLTPGAAACAAYTAQHAAHAPPPALLAAITASCEHRSCEMEKRDESGSTETAAAATAVEEAAVDVMCVGGTFDRLHAGHRHMLALCVLLARAAVHVGVTAAALLRAKAHRALIQDYAVRRAALLRTLWLMHPRLAYRFEPLTDPAGPAQRLARIQAIVVSAETVRGAALINARRAARAMAPLRVFVVGFIPPPTGLAADALGKLSSSSLRAVEHDAAAAADAASK